MDSEVWLYGELNLPHSPPPLLTTTLLGFCLTKVFFSLIQLQTIHSENPIQNGLAFSKNNRLKNVWPKTKPDRRFLQS